MLKLSVTFTLMSLFSYSLKTSGELLSVVVLYRHGDRAPVRSYRYDPHIEFCRSLGFGQLTNIGKMQHYKLGKWFRDRYGDFLQKKYDPRDIRVVSSDYDRCIMSAASNLAGLYPPECDQVWNPKLMWQPIPIHTIPKTQDPYLAQDTGCPKYEKLYQELMKSKTFLDFFNENSELLKYLSENTGQNISTLEDIKILYDTLYVENLYNLTLPPWTRCVFPQTLSEMCACVWKSYTFTLEMAKLKTGPLIDYIASHFENILADAKGTAKFLMLSGHDSNIVDILNVLNMYDGHWPPYASTLIFELRKNKECNFVNFLYKNSSEPIKMTLPNCDFDCDFDRFRKILGPIRLSMGEKDEECSIK